MKLLLLLMLAGCAHLGTPPAAPLPFSSDCPTSHPVKGNADSKIFHTPLSPWYEQTIPEICFKTIEDAVEAGYNPPQRW